MALQCKLSCVALLCAVVGTHAVIQPALIPDSIMREKSVQRHNLPPYHSGPVAGGGNPIKLFSGVAAPGESKDTYRAIRFEKADVTDPVAIRCAPGDYDGKWYYDVFHPKLYPHIVPLNQANRKDAAVIIAPGGGFQFLAWHKEGTQIATWLNTLGISAFVLRYRVPSTSFKTLEARMSAIANNRRTKGDNLTIAGKALQDAQRALSKVRSLAGYFNLNASRIGMMGFSAGAILAAETSYFLERQYPKTDAIDDLSHTPDFVLLIYGTGSPPQVHGSMPPTFMAIAWDDPCVPAHLAESYGMALESAGNNPEMHIFAEGRHGYGDCSMYTADWLWKDVCSWPANAESFLTRVLGM